MAGLSESDTCTTVSYLNSLSEEYHSGETAVFDTPVLGAIKQHNDKGREINSVHRRHGTIQSQ